MKYQWIHASDAARCVGGVIYPPAAEMENESIYELPFDDNTYLTYTRHPEYTAVVYGTTCKVRTFHTCFFHC